MSSRLSPPAEQHPSLPVALGQDLWNCGRCEFNVGPPLLCVLPCSENNHRFAQQESQQIHNIGNKQWQHTHKRHRLSHWHSEDDFWKYSFKQIYKNCDNSPIKRWVVMVEGSQGHQFSSIVIVLWEPSGYLHLQTGLMCTYQLPYMRGQACVVLLHVCAQGEGAGGDWGYVVTQPLVRPTHLCQLHVSVDMVVKIPAGLCINNRVLFLFLHTPSFLYPSSTTKPFNASLSPSKKNCMVS